MKPPLHLLITTPSTTAGRCCDDRPSPPIVARPAWPRRWTRKIAVAVPASLRVFRRQIADPVAAPAGTSVVTSSGQTIGTVRDVVVELHTGRSHYAVDPHEDRGDADVLLLPRSRVWMRDKVAVVDERSIRELARWTA